MPESLPEILLPYNISFKVVNGEVTISLKEFYSYLEKLELTYHRIAQHPFFDDEDEQTRQEAGAKVAANTINFLGQRLKQVFTEANIKKYSIQKENL